MLHPTNANYIFFLSVLGKLINISHLLCHKQVSINVKRLKLYSLFSHHGGTYLEMINNKLSRKILNKTHLNNLWVKEQITGKITKLSELYNSKPEHVPLNSNKITKIK